MPFKWFSSKLHNISLYQMKNIEIFLFDAINDGSMTYEWRKSSLQTLDKEWKISLTYLHHQFLCERPSILAFSMHQHIPIANEINCKLKTGYKFCKSCHCLVLTTSHAPFGNRKMYPMLSINTNVSFIFLPTLASFIRTLIEFLIYF